MCAMSRHWSFYEQIHDLSWISPAGKSECFNKTLVMMLFVWLQHLALLLPQLLYCYLEVIYNNALISHFEFMFAHIRRLKTIKLTDFTSSDLHEIMQLCDQYPLYGSQTTTALNNCASNTMLICTLWLTHPNTVHPKQSTVRSRNT